MAPPAEHRQTIHVYPLSAKLLVPHQVMFTYYGNTMSGKAESVSEDVNLKWWGLQRHALVVAHGDG